VNEKPKDRLQQFVSVREVKREPRPEQTEEEIKAWAMALIRADKKTLDLLATL